MMSWMPSRGFRLAPLLHTAPGIARDEAREVEERGTQTEDLEHTFHFDVHGSDRGKTCQIKGVFVTRGEPTLEDATAVADKAVAWMMQYVRQAYRVPLPVETGETLV